MVACTGIIKWKGKNLKIEVRRKRHSKILYASVLEVYNEKEKRTKNRMEKLGYLLFGDDKETKVEALNSLLKKLQDKAP